MGKLENGHTNDKVALVTGISGQDGFFLTKLLISRGYKVHGIIRRPTAYSIRRIDHAYDDPILPTDENIILHYGDLSDSACLTKLINLIRPSEIYNLAAQVHVQASFDIPEYTSDINAIGTLRLLNAIRSCRLQNVRLFQASSSELFGKVEKLPLTEQSPFYPRSPYAVAKLFAYWMVVNYREAYGQFAVNGILFSHESPRRGWPLQGISYSRGTVTVNSGETFVTRKITRAVAKIHLGLMEFLELGNLNAKRDWGYAGDYVEAMWLMMQQEEPEDYIIATGETHSVRELVQLAFNCIGETIVWEGEQEEEVGKDKATGKIRVKVNKKFYRPNEVEYLIGDSSKAKKNLGWKPTVMFEELVKMMVTSDIELMKKNPTA